MVVAELILSAVMGLIAGAILSWFFFRMKKRKIENPQRIINNLEKQEREGKVFYVDGKPYDFRKDLGVAQKHFSEHLDELKKEETQQVYKPKNLPPLPPTPEPQKQEPEQKKDSHSLNKMLGRK